MEKDNKVLDIIISFVKAVKITNVEDEKNCKHYLDDGNNRLWGAKYLLGQIIRQFGINDDHYFISVAADKLWKEITNGKEDIKNYHYTMKVPVHKECKLNLYKGAAKEPFEKEKAFAPTNTFQYRQVFHDDHVIPIEDVIQKLISLETLNYENVQKILNNIYVCRMLKSENVELNRGNRNKREWDVKETIEKIYKGIHNINIVGWEYEK